MKKLYRSKTDRKLVGVCGGVAEYLNVDSTVVRLAFVILGCAAGSGLLIYFLSAMVIPEEPLCIE